MKQITLFDVPPTYTESQKRKWTKKYKEYCEKIFREKGDFSGLYCCGYHWCCDECLCRLENGCADCIYTIKTLARRFGILIDYNDYDFEKFEKKVAERYLENYKKGQ